MSNPNKIASLKTLSSELLDKTLADIRLHRKQSSPRNERHFLAVEYLLQEAIEYVDGAWEMIKSGKPNASIALSRWVLEASLNLQWTVADRNKIDKRLEILIGEALRQEACLFEGLAELWPDKCPQYKSQAEKARKVLDSKKLESLHKRLESIQTKTEPNRPNLYHLYRICCAKAHPNLNVWKRFNLTNDTIISKDPTDEQSTAYWMAAASTFYLVIFTCHLTELGDKEQLEDWWKTKIQPLLNDDEL